MKVRWTFLGFLALLAITGCQSPDAQSKPPNIVFILADDLGWSQLGCYGGAAYRTPNIDQLAAEGIRFTQAYAAAAVCSPTRAAIMSGKHPARLHLTDFLKGEAFPDSLLEQPDWQQFLPLEVQTLAETLRQSGYRTAHFGKWHLSKDKRPPESESHNPLQQGFDEQLITYKPGAETDAEGDPHNVDTITTRAVEFLKRNRDSTFFLYLSHNAIHDPIMESAGRVERFAKDRTQERHDVDPVIAAMTERLDDGVGTILRTLAELELEKETLVIFYSDNGGKSTYAAQAPFRAGKGWLYEGGIRVPLILRWPGKIAEGSTTDEFMTSVDLYPTLAAVAETPVDHLELDGRNLLPLLMGNTDSLESRPLFWHYPHYHRGSGMRPASAVRSGRYKLIEWHQRALLGQAGALELYDLKNDPGESQNLADSLPEIKEKLYTQLKNWRTEVGAQLPSGRQK